MRSEGYSNWSAKFLSVCYHSIFSSEVITRFYAKTKVRIYSIGIDFSRFLTHEFSKILNPSI